MNRMPVKSLDLILKLRNEQGITSIIISHKLDEIDYCADRITILRDGCTVETLDKKQDNVTEERIIRGMVGREMSSRFPVRADTIQDEVAFENKIGQFTINLHGTESSGQCII